jgi:general secretion pathway protein M
MSLRLTSATGPRSAWNGWRQRWQQLSPRERGLLSLGLCVMGLALVWWLALAPALRTLHDAPLKQAAVDTEWQHLKDLQSQAQALQKQPRLSSAEALQALQKTTTDLLGSSARLNTTGDRYTVTLTAVSAQDLAQWLAQARIQARAVPVESHLQRTESPPDKNTRASTTTWNGSVVLSLPAL